MKDIIEKALKFALKDIEKYGSPQDSLFNSVNHEGQRLAKLLKADENVVMLGTILMDCKLGEAISQNKIKEHSQMSAMAAREFLSKNGVQEDIIKKVEDCALYHHGIDKYPCIEAEICTNADCYKFLLPKNIFSFIAGVRARNDLSYEDTIKFAYDKMEEKRKALSLDICIKELDPYYKMFKQLFQDSLNNERS